MNDTTLAYTAGLLDGEGCYHIGRAERAPSFIFMPCVMVGMTHRPTIEWLKSEFGGHTYERPARTLQSETSYLWQLSKFHPLRAFLPAVAHFAKTKRLHALLLLEFTEAFPYLSSAIRNQERLSEMNKYFEVLRALNSRGPGSNQLKDELTKVIKIA